MLLSESLSLFSLCFYLYCFSGAIACLFTLYGWDEENPYRNQISLDQALFWSFVLGPLYLGFASVNYLMYSADHLVWSASLSS